MKLYNTLTRQVEEVKPLNPPAVTVYTCGPTVYERAHIGNLASFIYADTLRRALALAFPNANIKHVMNITDVDDKTIKSSRTEFPELEPKEALKRLTRHYEKLFMKDLQTVGVDTSQITFVHATEYIPQMQELIQKILSKGFAYITEDGVFFDTLKYHNYEDQLHPYGVLTQTALQGLAVETQRTGSDEYEKHEAIDFALWKTQKEGEPAWDFEIEGRNMIGRPGWHIECSAMSTGELGQPFDIHTGGIDLKFPHHENEIAQSVAVQDNPRHELARYFFHNEHMLVDGQKMSKSLNNFYSLEDIRAKNFDPLAFRLLVLQAHYRSQSKFSWETLEAAQNRLKRIQNMAELRHQSTQQSEYAQSTSIDRSLADIKEEMFNDLDTPAVLATIASELDNFEHNGLMTQSLDSFNKWLLLIDGLLGLNLESLTPDISDEHKQLIAEREKAREAKDFDKSDKLRKQLEEQGIGLRDTPHSPIWFRL